MEASETALSCMPGETMVSMKQWLTYPVLASVVTMIFALRYWPQLWDIRFCDISQLGSVASTDLLG